MSIQAIAIDHAVTHLRKAQDIVHCADDEKDELYGKTLTEVRQWLDEAIADLQRAVLDTEGTR